MRLTDLLTWTAATKPVLYHDVAKHQTAFSSPDTPPWRVQGWKQYKSNIIRPRQPHRESSRGPSESSAYPAFAWTRHDGPCSVAAAQVRPLRYAGIDRVGMWA